VIYVPDSKHIIIYECTQAEITKEGIFFQNCWNGVIEIVFDHLNFPKWGSLLNPLTPLTMENWKCYNLNLRD
jgi:hypothetical protein